MKCLGVFVFLQGIFREIPKEVKNLSNASPGAIKHAYVCFIENINLFSMKCLGVFVFLQGIFREIPKEVKNLSNASPGA